MKIFNRFLFTSSVAALGLATATATHGSNDGLPWWRARPNLLQIAGVPYPTGFDFDFSKGTASVDAVLKGMVDSGINVLDLRTVYDSGIPYKYSGHGSVGNVPYDAYNCLYQGLAINDLKTVNPFYESKKGKGDAKKTSNISSRQHNNVT